MSFLGSIGTIRGRLWAGFGVLVALLVVAGALAQNSMSRLTEAMTSELKDVQLESRLASQLSASTMATLAAGTRYLETQDSLAQVTFREQGWSAHRIQGDMNSRPNQSAAEVAAVAAIDARLSAMEARFARAHRLADMGREVSAHAEAGLAQLQVDTLLLHLERLGFLKAQKVAAVARRLETQSSRRTAMLLTIMALAVVVGVMVVALTIRSIGAPLDSLVEHARRLSEGDLSVRTRDRLPGEFQILGQAMNQTGDSLSRVVSVAARTAENVASSAHQLSSVSGQISISAGQMAAAMIEVSQGAEQQVRQLRSIDDALQAIQRAAESVNGRSTEVRSLAGEIEGTAADKRREIERALTILVEVKTSVEQAAAEVMALNSTTADINKFVKTVGSIAEQTNLLALNAAIEAARAGESGRGFAVVADEVRKLAEQAQRAAEDIVQLTGTVTSRVTSSSRVMQTGAERVIEIERVSREIDDALQAISGAAERARTAADQVAVAAAANAAAVTTATTGLDSIARTAENHAAAAEQVSASTQQQSAACEEMNTASNELLQGSTQLRELVGGLRT
ncbi:MAG TPA: methyl-accepting chemotaxis protein [Gemmatimonadaceae bacterium]|nr:methyl-accepting chemotaxis protein [Gemmatimonadaceae bacterium]